MSKKIKLSQGKFAIVDDEDYHYLNRFKWSYASIKGIERVFRSLILFRGRANMYMEDFIITRPIGGTNCLLHKDGNILNMQKNNISYIAPETVKHLARKTKGKYSSDYKGVTFNKASNYWIAQVERGVRKTPDNKKIAKVNIKTEKEAGLIYNKIARELYGERAYQNKIS